MNSTRRTAPHAVAAVLAELEQAAFARVGRIQRQDVARELQVAKSAVSAWFAARQVPRDRYLDGLAKVYSGGSRPLYEQYREQLSRAAQTEAPSGQAMMVGQQRLNAIERMRAPGGSLNIGIVRFSHFSSFFEDVLETFAKYCSVVPFLQEIPIDNTIDVIENGDVDIAAAFFATPDRAIRLRFIPTPLKVGVNAITFGIFARAVNRGDFSLNKESTALPIVPIANPKEVGDLYARYFLGYRHEIIPSSYSVDGFTDALLKEFSLWMQDQEQPLPVVFVDELMALQIHQELLNRLIKRHECPDNISIRTVGVPILLMGNSLLFEHGSAPELHPNYNVSMCVARQSPELFEFLTEAWSIFLRSNINYMISRYCRLYNDMIGITTAIETLILRGRYQADVMAQWDNGIMAELCGKAKDGMLRSLVVDSWADLIARWMRLEKGDPSASNLRSRYEYPWSTILEQAAEDIEPTSKSESRDRAQRREKRR
jgi:hypothetical protein